MNTEKRFNDILQEFYHGTTITNPAALLQRAALRYPHKVALVCQGRRITYRELYRHATALSLLLLERGVAAGQRVCLLFGNSIDYYIAYFGIWQAGAIIAPLNTFFTAKELTHVLHDAEPSLVLASTDFVPLLQEVGASYPIMTQEDFPLPTHEEITLNPVAPDQVVALLYTSGTTGLSKGVMLTAENIIVNVAQIIAGVDLSEDDSIFGVLPLFHSFAQNTCIWTAFYLGLTVILVPKIDKRAILQGLADHPTVVMGVPAFYGLLCMMKTAPLDKVRYFICGGDALSDKIRGAFELIYRRKIINGYGLTETSPFIAAHLVDELVATTTIGLPAPGIEVKIVDEQGNAVAQGQIGSLLIKGKNVMKGYYRAPEQTAKVLTPDGWFITGDLARIDRLGRIHLQGREKDLIIHKGLNIYPQEVENILMSHPLVFRAALIGKPDEDAGEVPIAFVAVRERRSGIEQELKRLCRDNVAAYKLPKQFIILDDLPVTATAKINKRQLKAEYFHGT